MLYLTPDISVTDTELDITFVRAQGAGGQNVNKVSSAAHLRFDIPASSLPEALKQRLLSLNDQRISKDGVLVIKAQEFRNQEQNRNEALRRLKTLLLSVAQPPKKRIPTRPGAAARQQRREQKTRQGQLKRSRTRVVE